MNMEDIGYLELQCKSIETDNKDIVIIAGYANKAFNELGEILPDRDDEVVSTMAYELDNFMLNPIVLFNHDRNTPVGIAKEVKLDDKGLFVKIEVHKSVDERVFNLVKSGIVKSFSIGFRGKTGKMVGEDTFMYTKVELYEVSIVTIPASPQSTFSIVKSANGNCILAKQKLLDKENDVTQEELKESVDEIKKSLETLKVDLIVDVKELLATSDNSTNEKIELLDLIKDATLDSSNIEEYITALNVLNTKINSKLTELIGE